MSQLLRNSLVDIPGLRVGHWADDEAGTGCTVVLCTGGACAGVDVRGAAPGTRETDLLRPENRIDRVHAILLAGGSAFGLAAADGALRWLEEQGVGYDVGVAKVPIVPAAILFDLAVARPDVRPGPEAGYAACQAASSTAVAQGSVGAGVGATVGKALGLRFASRGGLGMASTQTSSGLIVAALAVVNAFGNIVDPATGRTIAGVRRVDPGGRCTGFHDPVQVMAEGARPEFSTSNTTLGVVATNALLSKSEVTKVAQMAHDGMARAVRPVHTGIDGDVVFALSVGAVQAEAPQASPDLVGALAADMLAQAIVNGVRAAQSRYGLPCASDLL